MSSETLREAKNGNREALGYLLTQVEPTVRTAVNRLQTQRFRSKFCTEDMVQKTMLAIMSDLQNCKSDDEAGFHAWAAAVAKNAVYREMERFRALKRCVRREVRSEKLKDAYLPDPSTPVIEILVGEELREMVMTLARGMNDTTAEVIGRVMEGKTNYQIAKETGMTRGKVEKARESFELTAKFFALNSP